MSALEASLLWPHFAALSRRSHHPDAVMPTDNLPVAQQPSGISPSTPTPTRTRSAVSSCCVTTGRHLTHRSGPGDARMRGREPELRAEGLLTLTASAITASRRAYHAGAPLARCRALDRHRSIPLGLLLHKPRSCRRRTRSTSPMNRRPDDGITNVIAPFPAPSPPTAAPNAACYVEARKWSHVLDVLAPPCSILLLRTLSSR